jgi:alpha-beta hydrolase superfamily lysophospholipase
VLQALLHERVFTMLHDNEASNGNAKRKFIEEIETTITTNDKVNIFIHAWVPGNAERILLCVQGLGGHGGYYEELAYQLALEGTIVVAPDLRGHGHSDGVRGDIDGFDRYLADIDTAVLWVSTTWPDTSIFVLGESMGVSIAIQYVTSGRYRSHKIPLVGIVLVSPVLSSAILPTFGEVIHFIRSLLVEPKHPSIAVTGREELGCRDPAFNALLRVDPLFVRLVSARFLIRLTLWLWQSKQKARQIKLPLLVLLGGRDYVARLSGTSAFLRRMPAREQRIVTFPQAYHCLLRDPDTPALVRVMTAWLAAHHGK